MNPRRAAFKIALIVAVLAAIAGGRALRYRRFLARPYPPEAGAIEVDVPPGASLRQVARLLESSRVVASARMFRRLAKTRREAGRVQAGDYEFQTPIRPGDVLSALVHGRVKVRQFTIPEGCDLRQIAQVVAGTGSATAEACLGRARSAPTAAAFGIQADSLEGYLFPATYRYRRTTTLDELLTMMVRRFRAVFGPTFEEQAREKDLTVHQVVTLASIVEKETGRPEERPRVAAVFLNRLRLGMPLQADPTVIYGLPAPDGSLTREALATPTPYNTYVIHGLPPGPICSPGEASLRAVLWPDDADDLYFVARNDGTHEFNRTYPAHAKAVRRYQIQGGLP